MWNDVTNQLAGAGPHSPCSTLWLGLLGAGLSLSACVAGSVNTPFPGRESGYAAADTSKDVSLEEITASVQREGSAGSVSSEHYLRLFEAAADVLIAQCAACHRDGNFDLRSRDAIREGVFLYPGLVKRGEPELSRLLTKGAHAGPALLGAEAETVAAWIIASASQNKAEVADDPLPVSQSMAPVALEEGDMAIALGELGLAEGFLRLKATLVDGDLTLSHAEIGPGPNLDARFDALHVSLRSGESDSIHYAFRQRRVYAPARTRTRVPGVHMIRLNDTPEESPETDSFELALHFDNLVLSTAS